MANDGKLILNILDSSGQPVSGKFDVELKHQHLSDHKSIRDLDVDGQIAIGALHRSPRGVYKLRLASKKFQPVAQFINIKPSGDTEFDIVVVERDRPGGELEESIGNIVARHRDALNAELSKLDPRIVTELAVSPGCDELAGGKNAGDFFSDWHDNWNDGKRWAKTWGKAGDDILQLDPLDELRERYQITRLRELIANPQVFREVSDVLPKPLREFINSLLEAPRTDQEL